MTKEPIDTNQVETHEFEAALKQILTALVPSLPTETPRPMQ